MPNTKACFSRMTLLSVAAAVCIIVFLFPRSAFGQSMPQVSISTTASSGFLYGSGFEYVYNQQVSTNYKNSELDWPFQFLFYSGEALTLDTSIGVFARLDVKEGLPGKVGTMTDSDFLNGDAAQTRTHYSQSDSYAERALFSTAPWATTCHSAPPSAWVCTPPSPTWTSSGLRGTATINIRQAAPNTTSTAQARWSRET